MGLVISLEYQSKTHMTTAVGLGSMRSGSVADQFSLALADFGY